MPEAQYIGRPMEEAQLSSDRFRPLLHFTPDVNWMNDPNGLVRAEDGYHLFYQHNPNTNTWGNIVWGHARSEDLLRWEDYGTSLAPSDVMAFSGSAVECDARLLDCGMPAERVIVAAYTGHDPDDHKEDQRIVYSKDGGHTWQDLVNGPVIDRRQEHFRDPRIFWHAESASWVMAVALSIQHRILFYASEDLRNWQERGSFHLAEEPGVEWECPELVCFDDPEKPGQSLWMLKVDVSRGAAAGGSGGKYFLGRFDGNTFDALPVIASEDGTPADSRWLDYGKDFYAGQVFSGTEIDGCPIWIGWASNWQYARETPTHPWRGCQSIPRKLSLVSTGNGYALCQQPIDQLNALRGAGRSLGATIVSDADGVVHTGFDAGSTFDLECRFEDWSADEFGLVVAKGANCETRIGFLPAEGKMFIDRRVSGAVDFSQHFPGVHEALLAFDATIDLRVIVDRSVIEVFAAGGRIVMTDLIFPDPDARSVEFYALRGGVSVPSAQCWPLDVS